MPGRKGNSDDSEVFTAGKIRTVYCKDFVTYDECIFKPTPYLNIIIGPNGTGKSTIVAAIVIGLGGDPKLLSRSSNISDYIKNNKEVAITKVEIFVDNEGETVTFCRKFGRNGKSEYFIDEKSTTKARFLQVVHEYNIQLANLCQFLPQDRVQDFARMNPQEILLNTLSSVCDVRVSNQLQQLKELRKQHVNSQKNYENNLRRLKDSESHKKGLESQLKQFRTRQNFLRTVEVGKIKKLWLEVAALEEKMDEYKGDLQAAQRVCDEATNKYNQLANNYKEINKYTADLTEVKNAKERLVGRNSNDLGAKQQALVDAKSKLRQAKYQMQQTREEIKNLEGELLADANLLQLLLSDLERIERDYKSGNMNERLEQCQTQINRFKTILNDINEKYNQFSSQIDELSPEIVSLQNQIANLQNEAQRKLDLLRKHSPDLYKAVMWLRANRESFEGVIYEPMILELNVPNAQHAKYFENIISHRDLVAFTCESKNDCSTLSTELIENLHLNGISIVHSNPAESCSYQSEMPIQQLRQYGLEAYLIDLIQGPAPILNYLCALYSIHKIPIGTEAVDQHVDSMPRNIRNFFGANVRYSISISKYTNEASIMQRTISGRGLLSSVNAEEVQSLKERLSALVRKRDQLRNHRAKTQATGDEISEKKKEVELRKKDIQNEEFIRKEAAMKVRRQKTKCEQMQAKLSGMKQEVAHFPQTARSLLDKIFKAQSAVVKSLTVYSRSLADLKVQQTRISVHERANQDLRYEMQQAKESRDEATATVDRVKSAIESHERRLNAKVQDALQSSKERRPSDRRFPHREVYDELPNNMEDLRKVMNNAAARLECMHVSADVSETYEQLCKDIVSLRHAIDEAKNQEEAVETDIKAIYAEWYPKVNEVISTINENFGNFMGRMKYVGEVQIARAHVYDFESYGVKIMVQYRANAPLQALDRHVQSGGERAVAIASYILGMQRLTHAPFRCVDEINQGMDAINERKIFETLVHEATQPDRAQFFYVTPKLMNNFSHNERLSVSIVYNGAFVEDLNVFNVER